MRCLTLLLRVVAVVALMLHCLHATTKWYASASPTTATQHAAHKTAWTPPICHNILLVGHILSQALSFRGAAAAAAAAVATAMTITTATQIFHL